MNAPTTTLPALNEGQQNAADEFLQFLFTDELEFDIRGPGGVGKTFLMRHLIDVVIPNYFEQCQLMNIEPRFENVEMTATTNKAAEVLSESIRRPVGTIHSFLCLKVKNDYKTGEVKLTRRNDWQPKEKTIFFIDEGSMIDSGLYYQIHAAAGPGCKIVYVGDHCQLPPVQERISPIYKNNIRKATLTENVRAADQPALLAVCDQLRSTTQSLDFQPIQIVSGVIDYVDDDGLKAELDQRFAQQNMDDRILCYTNEKVRLFNDYIRGLRNLPAQVTQGEILVNTTAYITRDVTLPVEAEVEVLSTGKTEEIEFADGCKLLVRNINIGRPNQRGQGMPIKVAEDPEYFHELKKYFAREKNWADYFALSERYPDLRPRDASTVYKAQGSTYDTVIIDLDDISTCNNPKQVAHMLYVALSRPRTRAVLYGELAPQYGGLIYD